MLSLIAACATATNQAAGPRDKSSGEPADARAAANAGTGDAGADNAGSDNAGESKASGAGGSALPGMRGPNYAFEIEAPQSFVTDIQRQTLDGRWQL